MKLAAKNRRSAFVLILLAVLLLFTVVGFAAGNSTASAVESGAEAIRGFFRNANEQLRQANYIGKTCTALFDAFLGIQEYWWAIYGVLALVACFFGYRVFRIVLALGGFYSGFVGGLYLYPELLELIPDMEKVPALQLVVAGILGIAGLLLTQFFFKAAVVIGAGYAAYLFSQPYLASYENEMLFRILVGVCAAILVFLIFKYLIILATGLIGGIIAVEQLTVKISAVHTPILDENQTVTDIFKVIADLGLGVDALTAAFIIGAAVGLFGAIFQFASSGRKRL